MQKTVVESMGKFVYDLSYETLPQAIIEKAKTCLLNGIGIGIACHETEFAAIARKTIKAEEVGIAEGKAATIFCDGARVSVMGAAFANAVLFHGRAQEDTLGSSHTGTVITPAVLAIAEREGNSGKEILAALVAGYELVGALDREISAFTTPRGFRASPVFGIFGSAAAASKLLKLSEAETIHALGFAAAFASGTLECFAAGTTEWRFEVGVASREGILASLIARNGAQAARTAMEGKTGFLNAFADSTEKAGAIVESLGKRWEILNAGFKPYPVCAFNQTPVITMLDLIEDQRLEPEEVKKIVVRVNPYEFHYAGMNYRGPFSTIGATLMSTPFCLAVACVDKTVTLEGISRFSDPKILSLVERIEHIPDENVPRFSCIIEVTGMEGEKAKKEMIITPSYYNFDLDETIALIKRVTAEVHIAEAIVESLVKTIRNFDTAENVGELIPLLGQRF